MSKSLRKKAVNEIADMMQAHYENPMAGPYEFLYDDEDVAQYVDDLVSTTHNMYHKSLKSFREEVMMAVAKKMKVNIKIV